MSADNLSPADLAAIDAIAAANLVTNRALQELARAMLDGPQSENQGRRRRARRRLFEVDGLRLSAPAAYGDADSARSFGGKLKAARRCH
jgi:aspartate/methionine/tyrosine aminotransferase